MPLEAIPISVDATPLPQLVTIVRPADEPDGPTRDSPLVPGRLIHKPRMKREESPKQRPGHGGHSRKVSDSYTGYAGHHHGRTAYRWPERSELDWDGVVELDLEPEEVGEDEPIPDGGVRDGAEREDGTLVYDPFPV